MISPEDLAAIRSSHTALSIYLAVEKAKTIWTAITEPCDAGAVFIPYRDANLIEEPFQHCSVWLGSASGLSDLGVVRLRSKETTGLNVAYNHLDLGINEHLTIKKQVRPWAILPSIALDEDNVYSFAQEDQGTPYTDENTLVPPLARIGSSAACAFLENGQATIPFYSDSLALNGASLVSHAWNFEGGTPATSTDAGSAGTPIQVTWNSPGQYWVDYTVTDSNGKTHTRYCRVYVFSRTGDNAPVTDFNVTGLQASFDDGGWSLSFTLPADAAVVEEGAQIVLFCEQTWGSERRNIYPGWVGRENILFVGWVKSVKTDRAAAGGGLVGTAAFECIGPSGILKETESFPANLIEDASPNAWHKTATGVTADLFAIHLLRYHSTMHLLADFYPSGVTLNLRMVDVSESALYEQINTQVYESIRANLVANRLGQLIVERNQQFVPTNERTGEELFALEDTDWTNNLSLSSEVKLTPTAQVDFAGFYWTTDAEGKLVAKNWYALAPERELSFGKVEKVIGTQISSQDESCILAGLHFAQKNNDFADVGVSLAGFYPLDVIPQTKITISLSGSDNVRGLVWDSKRFWIRRVTHKLEAKDGALLATTELSLEAESSGPAGVPNIVPEKPSKPPDEEPPVAGDADGADMVFVATKTKVGRTKSFRAENVYWEDITGAITGTIVDFVLDPFNPVSHGYVLTETVLWEGNHLDSSARWTAVKTATSLVPGGTFRRVQKSTGSNANLFLLIYADTGYYLATLSGNSWYTFLIEETAHLTFETNWSAAFGLFTQCNDVISIAYGTWVGPDPFVRFISKRASDGVTISDHSSGYLTTFPQGSIYGGVMSYFTTAGYMIAFIRNFDVSINQYHTWLWTAKDDGTYILLDYSDNVVKAHQKTLYGVAIRNNATVVVVAEHIWNPAGVWGYFIGEVNGFAWVQAPVPMPDMPIQTSNTHFSLCADGDYLFTLAGVNGNLTLDKRSCTGFGVLWRKTHANGYQDVPIRVRCHNSIVYQLGAELDWTNYTPVTNYVLRAYDYDGNAPAGFTPYTMSAPEYAPLDFAVSDMGIFIITAKNPAKVIMVSLTGVEQLQGDTDITPGGQIEIINDKILVVAADGTTKSYSLGVEAE